ncbi:MAG: hypothetical protein EPO62_06420 [Candidatus Nitrosotenuis sp.]|nr:MAG: hypothetical protein EPO62_06420 [Candidatus Nitrosotenuis sp.]
MEDLRIKTRGQLDTLEKIMLRIPLYHGYKEKELRRESDSLLRNHIYQNLLDAKQNLKKKQSQLIENNQMDLGKKIDKIIVSCDTVAERIHHAEGGYSGFWDAVKIKEKELDMLYQFDVDISAIADETKTHSNELLAASHSGKAEDLSTITQKIDLLDEKITARTNLLNGYGDT